MTAEATVSQRRRRAGALQPEERRRSVIDATLRLIAAGSRGLTTSDIAREAGIAEGTIFRVFATKEELLHACLERVLASDPVLSELAAAATKPTQRERAIEACEAIRRHMVHLGPTIEALTPLGVNQADPERRAAFVDLLITTVERLLDGGGPRRRLQATVLVHTMVGGAARAALPNPPRLDSAQVVDLVLAAPA